MRHPGYAGALLTYWGAPIFLGSLWMFIPVMFITVILVVRTNLEDNTLQEKLDGCRECGELIMDVSEFRFAFHPRDCELVQS